MGKNIIAIFDDKKPKSLKMILHLSLERNIKDNVPPVVDPHPLTTPLTVPPISLGSKEASGRQIGFTLSSKTNGESNLRTTRSKSNTLRLPL